VRDSELNELDDFSKKVFKSLQKGSYDTLTDAIIHISSEMNISEDKASKAIFLLWKKDI
jgi:hypothetical protein